jgi:glycosyltransferase involved in cell wall biosynthesis
MRITLVTHFFPAHGGGVERMAGQLAERLVGRGLARIDWHASDCDAPPAAAPGLTLVPAGSCNGLERAVGVPYPIWSPTALLRLFRAVRSASVVHLHDCLYLPVLAAFAAARFGRRRAVVVTQHIGHVPYRNPVLRAVHAVANRLLGAWVLGGADQVVFESESVRVYFAARVRFRSPPLLIENGVDTGTFRPCSAAERLERRAKLGIPPGRPLLLFLGRFVEKKGLGVLRELTGRVSHAHWLFAGWGPIDPAAWDRPNVSVVRRPGHQDLAQLYQAADLLVLPSVGEGFPLSVQEAMACGTPAMIGEETAAGCPDAGDALLSERVAGAGTAARWAERIESLLAAPDKLESLRPRVAAFAAAHWSWDKCVARYAEVLHACAIRHGQGWRAD